MFHLSGSLLPSKPTSDTVAPSAASDVVSKNNQNKPSNVQIPRDPGSLDLLATTLGPDLSLRTATEPPLEFHGAAAHDRTEGQPQRRSLPGAGAGLTEGADVASARGHGLGGEEDIKTNCYGIYMSLHYKNQVNHVENGLGLPAWKWEMAFGKTTFLYKHRGFHVSQSKFEV